MRVVHSAFVNACGLDSRFDLAFPLRARAALRTLKEQHNTSTISGTSAEMALAATSTELAKCTIHVKY